MFFNNMNLWVVGRGSETQRHWERLVLLGEYLTCELIINAAALSYSTAPGAVKGGR